MKSSIFAVHEYDPNLDDENDSFRESMLKSIP